jgi:hypothetical protein
MDLQSSSDIETALTQVGEQLAYELLRFSVVVVGGAALNLLGIVKRSTSDVDILAFSNDVENSSDEALSRAPEPVPPELALAIEIVAGEMNLDPHWLNVGPGLQWAQGLPEGLGKRLLWNHYGPSDEPAFGLDVGLASRYDLIFFKLYAAADHASTGSVHYKDLLALEPTPEELDAAADWIRPQNASPEFHKILDQLLDHLKRQLATG